MKRTLGLGMILFLGALGAVIGYKLSSEAMAVIAGVVLGVLASVPMSILVLVLVRKSMQQSQQMSQPAQPRQNYPPVIVVGGGQQLPGPQQQDPWVDGQWKPAEDQPTFKKLGED